MFSLSNQISHVVTCADPDIQRHQAARNGSRGEVVGWPRYRSRKDQTTRPGAACIAERGNGGPHREPVLPA
eukprot:926461-Alexandrium_andersonii.AAC.1